MLLIQFLIFLIFSMCYSQENQTEKYKNLDLDEIINNSSQMQTYIDCFLDKAECTAIAEQLKNDIVDALDNGCAKCTDEQKEGLRKIVAHLTKTRKDWWKELVAKYDPEGKYNKKYADLIVKEGFDI